MRALTVLLLSGSAALAACSGNPNDPAAKACVAEAANRLSGKTYEINAKDFAANAKAEAADTWLLKAPVTFDKGLATEYQQTCTCRVRVDKSGANVLFMQFDWDNLDLRQPKQ